VVDGWRADVPISDKTVWFACQSAARAAGIEKHISPHTLRHSYPRSVLKNAHLFTDRFCASSQGPSSPKVTFRQVH
jgi:integrase